MMQKSENKLKAERKKRFEKVATILSNETTSNRLKGKKMESNLSSVESCSEKEKSIRT